MNLKEKTWSLLTELIEDHEDNLRWNDDAKFRNYQFLNNEEEYEIRYRLQALKTCKKVIEGGTENDTTT